MLYQIKKNQLKFFGPIIRKDCIENNIPTGKFKGKEIAEDKDNNNDNNNNNNNNNNSNNNNNNNKNLYSHMEKER